MTKANWNVFMTRGGGRGGKAERAGADGERRKEKRERW
jgi:hypothetical protein